MLPIMKKLLFALIFVPTISYAANWVSVSISATGDKFKVDSTSITRNGNEVTFWEIINNAKRSDTGNLSSKNQMTINCRTKEFNTKYTQTFSDYDGQGTLSLQYSSPSTWTPIPPDSTYENVMKFVCKK